MKWCIPLNVPWLPKSVLATTIWPFVFFKERDELIERNEQVHVYQWLELLWIGFPFVYGYFYLKNRFQGAGHWMAYYHNPLEAESRAAEDDPTYKRRFLGWRDFL